MVETLGRNLAHQVSNAAFFEMGRVFRRAGKTVEEEERLSLGLMGQADKGPLEARRANQADDLFLRMKGAIEAMARTLHVPDVSFAPCARRHFEAGQAVSVASCGQTVGELGMLSQAVRNEWRMNEPVAVAELRLAPLLQAAFRLPAARPLPVYPSVSRDVAMVVAEDVTHERVLGVIRKNAPSELTSMELFDIFRGEAIGRGRKSLAYTLVFRSLDRTLTDEEANGHFEAIKAALRRELQAEMREG
jgi:phenylalanyl-tRNA synthetase beta chain